MKEAKVIHINDGTGIELTNGNRHYAFDCVWAGEMLSMYINEGYEISQIIPDFTPGEPGVGGYAFYKTGFTAIMVRELTEDSKVITKEDWDEKNTVFQDEYYYNEEDGFDYDDWEEDLLD